MFNPKFLNDTFWLAEPTRLRRALEEIRTIPTCPSAREIVETRRQRLEEARTAASKAIRAAKGKVGVIGVYGPIEQRYSRALAKLGGTSTEEIGLAFDALLNDASVEAIVFHVDSPGGGSYGIEELSDKIFQGRSRKKTYAMVDSLGASAAYWIATSAEMVICTPGGDVGSVGAYCIHIDESKSLEEEGLTVTLIKAGKYKAETAPFAPLSTEAKSHLQEMVDATYSRFLNALKRNRGLTLDEVRRDFGEGRLLMADDALKARMIDRVMTADQLMGRLTGAEDGGRKASAEVLRLRHQHQKAKVTA